MYTREEVVARLHTEKIGIGNFVNEIRSHSVFTAKSLENSIDIRIPEVTRCSKSPGGEVTAVPAISAEKT